MKNLIYFSVLALLLSAFPHAAIAQVTVDDQVYQKNLEDIFGDSHGEKITNKNTINKLLSEELEKTPQYQGQNKTSRNPNNNRRKFNISYTPPLGSLVTRNYDPNDPSTILASNEIVNYLDINLSYKVHENGRTSIDENDMLEIFHYLVGDPALEEDTGLIGRLNEKFGTDLWIGPKIEGDEEANLESAKELLFKHLSNRPEAFLHLTGKRGVTSEQAQAIRELLVLNQKLMSPDDLKELRYLERIQKGTDALSESEKSTLSALENKMANNLSPTERNELKELKAMPPALDPLESTTFQKMRSNALKKLLHQGQYSIDQLQALEKALIAQKEESALIHEAHSQVIESLEGKEKERFQELLRKQQEGLSSSQLKRMHDLEKKAHSNLSLTELKTFQALSKIRGEELTPSEEKRLEMLQSKKHRIPSAEQQKVLNDLAVQNLRLLPSTLRKIHDQHGVAIGQGVWQHDFVPSFPAAWGETQTPLFTETSGLGGLFSKHTSNGSVPGEASYELGENGNVVGYVNISPPVAGNTVVTTIHEDLQRILFEEIEKMAHVDSDRFGRPRGISGIFIDTSSLVPDENTGHVAFGDVLAVVSYPTVDNSQLSPILDEAYYEKVKNDPMKPLNARVGLPGPGGSILKVLSGLSVTHAAKRDEYFTVPSPAVSYFGGHDINDYSSRDRGIVTLPTIYELSLNPGAAKYAEHFGPANRAGHHELGLDDPDQPLPDWSKGFTHAPDKVIGPKEEAMNAIGQSYMEATPAGIAMMFAGVARGRKPRGNFLLKVLDSEGKPVPVKHEDFRSEAYDLKFDSKSLEISRKGVFDVVNGSRGTGHRAKHWGLCVYGKTSTAQWKESDKSMMAWFGGYVTKCGEDENGLIVEEEHLFAFTFRYESEGNEKVSGGKTAARMFANVMYRFEEEGHLEHLLRSIPKTKKNSNGHEILEYYKYDTTFKDGSGSSASVEGPSEETPPPVIAVPSVAEAPPTPENAPVAPRPPVSEANARVQTENAENGTPRIPLFRWRWRNNR